MAANSSHDTQTTSAMGPPAHPASMPVRKLDIGSLMSPPDHALDNFNSKYHHDDAEMTDSFDKEGTDKHPMPMSPPISPCNKPMATTEVPTNSIKDPVLYPSDEVPSSPAQTPLFAPLEEGDHKLIEEHMQKNANEKIFVECSPPELKDYELALSFKSQLQKTMSLDPKGYRMRTIQAALADNRAIAQRNPHRAIAAKPAVKASRSRGDHRVQKIKSPRRSHVQPSISPYRPPPQLNVNVNTEPKARAAGPDKDFDNQPDFCPPIDSLPPKSNLLKVDWKGQPLDNSNDPFRHLLHPDELSLASNLRLDCATYLTSKRRLFQRRLYCFQQVPKKDFRKTDAQQACKIDVNKASKLWTAFERAGWFDPKWMVQHAGAKLG
ncbi:hypothetical protein FBEOM_8089 [Fusarium beomiforme]|uniref:SWIRM domain-containing protein n=1 Tax=Fusarium beomiforme TaxID=44412 RepID=A0A9P5DUU3_9HYPO|nr:hypothetical protein FBEOM_8089 [Fusarium beomiforme]